MTHILVARSAAAFKVCDKVPKASAEIKAKCVAQINEDTPALMKEMGEALRLHFCVEAKICTV